MIRDEENDYNDYDGCSGVQGGEGMLQIVFFSSDCCGFFTMGMGLTSGLSKSGLSQH